MLLLILFATRSYAQETETPKQTRETLHDVQVNFKEFRFSAGGGYARRLGTKDDFGNSSLNKLLDKIQNEVFLEIDGQYFFKEKWGIGLSINEAFASGKYERNTVRTNLLYVGPTFSMRFDFDKFLLVWNTGLGPLFYHEKYDSGTLNATTLGFQSNISAEYKLTKNLAWGFKFGWIAGTYKLKTPLGSYTSEYNMNLSNLNIGTYISFRTW